MVRVMGTDERVRCLLLTGAGQAFCAGGNVKSMAGASAADAGGPPPPTAARTSWTGLPMGASADDPAAEQKLRQATLTGALWEMDKPTIAVRRRAEACPRQQGHTTTAAAACLTALLSPSNIHCCRRCPAQPPGQA
jgi:hypothetical protein